MKNVHETLRELERGCPRCREAAEVIRGLMNALYVARQDNRRPRQRAGIDREWKRHKHADIFKHLHPQELVGGLTRTEHKPKALKF